MSSFLQDLRYSLRSLAKSKGLTTIAALTLALGVGANTAIFSIIDAALLRSLPYQDPDQLVRLYETESAPGQYPFAGPDFIDWRAQNKTFESMSLLGWPHNLNLNAGGEPDTVMGVATDAAFFNLLGVKPMLGRTWIAGEDSEGKDHVTVLSYGLWKSRFGGDPGVIGRTVEVDSAKCVIVGVMPEEFRYPERTQLWVPLPMSTKRLGTRGSHWASAIGRLKPGVSIRQGKADLTVIAANLEKAYPDSNYKVGADVASLHDDLVGDMRESFYLMLGAVGLVLAIACANVANLLLARGFSRQKEMALRSALGASRWRIVSQLLTESALLGVTGGAAGLVLGWGIIRIFAQSKSAMLPHFNSIELNGPVLLFTMGLALASGLIFGLAPALEASRPDLIEELKGGAGSSVSPSRRRRVAANVLVVAEIALSLLLLAGAGLLLEDFARLRRLDIGARTEGVWTGGVSLTGPEYENDEKRYVFFQALLDRARRIPGVDAVAISNRIPPEGGGNYYIRVRGQQEREASNQLVEHHVVTPDYFRAMGIALKRGRLFNDADVSAVMRLAPTYAKYRKDGTRPPPEVTNAMVTPTVINEAMARHFWPGRDPLGAMFGNQGGNGPWRQVIGVVNDVRDRGLLRPTSPESYDLFTGDNWGFLVAHTSMEASSLSAPMRRALAEVQPGLPFFLVRTMDEVIAGNTGRQQFLSGLVGGFAALALVLAAVGIYGVISYAVTQRTREIGVRMSLGATYSRVLGEVLAHGLTLAGCGLAIGLAGAYASGRLMTSLLHQIKPGDPWVLGGATLFLGVVALAACLIPARRAARLDPLIALRYE